MLMLLTNHKLNAVEFFLFWILAGLLILFYPEAGAASGWYLRGAIGYENRWRPIFPTRIAHRPIRRLSSAAPPATTGKPSGPTAISDIARRRSARALS
jgi:hypothetical protein